MGKLGIGFIFTADDPLVGIDLDGMFSSDGWNDAAEDILAHFGAQTYVEISPSRTGGHIITVGEVGKGHQHELADGTKIELYDRGRFFTVTGEGWGPDGGALVERQEAIQWLCDTYIQKPLRPAEDRSGGRLEALDVDIHHDAVPPFEKFEALSAQHQRWKGTWEKTLRMPKDQSLSSYELSLADMAAKAQWTPQEIVDTLVAFRRKHGGDIKHTGYYQETLRVAAEFAARTQALEALPHADLASAPESQAIVAHLTGLDVVRYVQTGKSPANYRVYLSDGDCVVVGLAEKARQQAVWQTLTQERLGVPFEALTKPQWQQFLVCLGKIVEREDVEEPGFVKEYRGYLQDYGKNGEAECYETVLASKPFSVEGVLHINVGHFTGWLRTVQRIHKTENEVLGILKIFGAEQTKIHRHPDYGDRRRTDVTRRYWRGQLDNGLPLDV